MNMGALGVGIALGLVPSWVVPLNQNVEIGTTESPDPPSAAKRLQLRSSAAMSEMEISNS